MELPESLPARLYLAAYDVRRKRLTGGSQLGYALRAAAVTDLLLGGYISDERGKPRAEKAAGEPGDPVLDHVLRQIAESRPRSWQHWVRREQGAIKTAVRDQLATGGWVRLEPRRVLGIFPVTRVTVRESRTVKRLVAIVADALRGTHPAARVNGRDAALVALLAAGDLKVALSKQQRRQHKKRVAELTERAGPAAPALRKVIQQAQAAAAGG